MNLSISIILMCSISYYRFEGHWI